MHHVLDVTLGDADLARKKMSGLPQENLVMQTEI